MLQSGFFIVVFVSSQNDQYVFVVFYWCQPTKRCKWCIWWYSGGRHCIVQRFNANIYSSYHGKLTHHNYFCEEQKYTQETFVSSCQYGVCWSVPRSFQFTSIHLHVGYGFRPWTTFVGNVETNKPMLISYMIVDTALSQASLVSAVFITCERFYAIRWPFKHRTLSTQAYRIAIFSVRALALLISAIRTGSNLLFSNK